MQESRAGILMQGVRIQMQKAGVRIILHEEVAKLAIFEIAHLFQLFVSL